MTRFIHVYCLVCDMRVALRVDRRKWPPADGVCEPCVCMDCWPLIRDWAPRYLSAILANEEVPQWLRPTN